MSTYVSEGVTYTLERDSNGVGIASVTRFNNCETVNVLASFVENDITYSVTSIGDFAFIGDNLATIVIPPSVISIGNNAFQYCVRLTTITFEGVSCMTSIGNLAFACSGLTYITIPASVRIIDGTAFNDCPALESIIVETNNQAYGNNNNDGVLFDKEITNLIQYPIGKTDSSYTIPDTVLSIDSHAFESCIALKSVTIPSSVQSIGEDAFSSCTTLKSVLWMNPTSLQILGRNAFKTNLPKREAGTVTYYQTVDASYLPTILNPSNPESIYPNNYIIDYYTYTVSYNDDLQTGEHGSDCDTATYTYGSTVTVIDSTKLKKTDRAFMGWNTAANGSGKSYIPSSTFIIDADIILYAQWSIVPEPPTNVSAWATGSTTVAISFTPSFLCGKSAITGYTVTSTPGNIKETMPHANSGIIQMAGLSQGVVYTFTMVATNDQGSSMPSVESNPITTWTQFLSQSGGNIYLRQKTSTEKVEWSSDNCANWSYIEWPLTITNTNKTNYELLTVKLTTDITFNVDVGDVDGYIVVGSDNITIDGQFKKVTVDDIYSYQGLIKNGQDGMCGSGKTNVTIQNVVVETSGTNTTLLDGQGWICQRNFGYDISCGVITVSNCCSRGEVDGSGAGGILGANVGLNASGGSICVENCYSEGIISGEGAGGIFGSGTGTHSFGVTIIFAENCYSVGIISGNGAGGIFGAYTGQYAEDNTSIYTIICYSTGTISGVDAGGIFGYFTGVEASVDVNLYAENCYTIGSICGRNAGGIFGGNAGFNAPCQQIFATNCYTIGKIDSKNSGGIFGANANISTCKIDNCIDSKNDVWSDATAERTIGTGVKNIWLLYDTNVQWLQKSFNTMIYNPSFKTITINEGIPQHSGPGLFVSGYKYIIYKNSVNGITINENTGLLTFASTLVDRTYEINVLVGKFNNSGVYVAYNSNIFTANVTVVATTPQEPTMGIATTTGSRKAEVTFTPSNSNGGSDILCYKATSSPGDITGTIPNGGGTTIPITDLSPDTTYTFSIVAINVKGASMSSSSSNSITTFTIPSAPTNICATATGGTRADVSFSPSSFNGGYIITSYIATSSPGNLTGTIEAGSGTTIIVAGLSPGVEYVFTVVAANLVGTSMSSSSSNSITTFTAPGAPTNVCATATGGTTADVSFSPTGFDGGSIITSYTATSIIGDIKGTIEAGIRPTIPISGLTPGVEYAFTVVATNDVGTSMSSRMTNYITTFSVPCAPTNVSATTTGSTTADVSFSPPSFNGGSIITSYTAISIKGDIKGTIEAGSGTTIPISGLSPGVEYTFEVVATNNIGTSLSSRLTNSIITFTVPGAPTNVSATATGISTAEISFSPPKFNGGSIIISYAVVSNPGNKTRSILAGSGTTIPISGLSPGVEYTFTVVAINDVGASISSGSSNSITTFSVPGAPINISATAVGISTAEISFSPPRFNGGSIITSYTVLSNPDNKTRTIAAGSGTRILMTGLSSGVEYTFTLVATNSVGTSVSSGLSNSITTFTVPGAPTNISATATGITTADVSFTSPNFNGGNPITSYTATSSPDNKSMTILAGSGTTIPMTGLSQMVEHTFTVVATNSVGTSVSSGLSNSISTFTVPGAPTNISATATGSTTADVSFSPACFNGGTAITSYRATSSPEDKSITIAAGSGTTIPMSNLLPGTEYTFTVVAINNVGTSVSSGLSNSISTFTVPGAPTNISATATGSTTADVSFSPSSFNGGTAITSYTATSSPGNKKINKAAGSGTTISISELLQGVEYTFTVAAINDIGTSVSSGLSNSISTFTVPGAPTCVSATATGSTTVEVSFTPSSFNCGTAITGYKATSSTGDKTNTIAAGSGTTIPISGLSLGTEYTFTVVAINDVGTSAPSSSSNSVTTFTVPYAPTSVSATTTGSTTADVSFTPSSFNHGTYISSYIATSFPGEIKGTLSSTSGGTTIPMVGLCPGATYTFAVVAVNDVGMSVSSSLSNSVTTFTVPGAPTRVSATTTGSTTSTVSFNAPIFDGGNAILSYTATSCPGEIKGTIPHTGGGTTIPISGLSSGVEYTFTVVATNAIGTSVSSGLSNSITTFTVPDPPINILATATGMTNADISFAPPNFNGGSAITSYTATSNTGDKTITVSASSGTTISMTGLYPGVEYIFTVVATNAFGTSVSSDQSNSINTMFTVNPGINNALSPDGMSKLFTTFAVPYPPTEVSATVTGSTTANIAFTAPSYDGGVAVISYTAVSNPGGIKGTMLRADGGIIPISGLSSGIEYTFTVVATNAVGTSISSSPSDSIVTFTYPEAPIIGTAVATGSTTANVSFDVPSYDGGSVILSYTAISSPGGMSGTVSRSDGGIVSISGLSSGVEYTFTVVATNAVGTSVSSSPSNSINTFALPEAPTIGAAIATGSTTATVSFVVPICDEGNGVLSYTATSNPGGISGTILASGGTMIPITGLYGDTRYTFTVFATNAVGTSVSSDPSNSITTRVAIAITSMAATAGSQVVPVDIAQELGFRIGDRIKIQNGAIQEIQTIARFDDIVTVESLVNSYPAGSLVTQLTDSEQTLYDPFDIVATTGNGKEPVTNKESVAKKGFVPRNALSYSLDGTTFIPLHPSSQANSLNLMNEGTRILCLNDKSEEEYIHIEKLKKGDWVKTYKHGCRKIATIYQGCLINNPNNIYKCMYKMEKTKTNGLTEDLIVTGGHSVLVDELGEHTKTNNIMRNPEHYARIMRGKKKMEALKELIADVKDKRNKNMMRPGSLETLDKQKDLQSKLLRNRLGVVASFNKRIDDLESKLLHIKKDIRIECLKELDTPKIDGKHLLFSSVSKDFKKLENNNTYRGYHFSLENDGDNNRKFCIWSNGILSETPSKNQIVQMNIMTKD